MTLYDYFTDTPTAGNVAIDNSRFSNVVADQVAAHFKGIFGNSIQATLKHLIEDLKNAGPMQLIQLIRHFPVLQRLWLSQERRASVFKWLTNFVSAPLGMASFALRWNPFLGAPLAAAHTARAVIDGGGTDVFAARADQSMGVTRALNQVLAAVAGIVNLPFGAISRVIDIPAQWSRKLTDYGGKFEA